MANSDGSDDDELHLDREYAQHLPAGVGLPEWAAGSFSSWELSTLAVVRDAAHNSPTGLCSLSIKEIAKLANVSVRGAARAITIAIAIGVVERDGRNLRNLHIYYTVG